MGSPSPGEPVGVAEGLSDAGAGSCALVEEGSFAEVDAHDGLAA